MELSSPVFHHEQSIPIQYTCLGENRSPPLVISKVPKEAKSLALIVDDPDATKGTFVHFVAWDLSPEQPGLEENTPVSHSGINDFGVSGWKGPCPPPGKTHRYFFKLYALDSALNLPSSTTKKDLEKAMQGHVIDKTELIGTFKK